VHTISQDISTGRTRRTYSTSFKSELIVKRCKVVRKVYQSRPFFGFRDAAQGISLRINALKKIDVKSSCLVDRWAANFARLTERFAFRT